MSEENPSADWSLDDARAWLRSRLRKGAKCPLCTQHAQTYRRKITKQMARSLISMYRAGGLDWVHIPTVIGKRHADEAKMIYWGLIEDEPSVRREDGGRTGWWRVTPKGESFLRGEIRVEKYALVYDGRFMGHDEPEATVSISDALGTPFNLADLLAGR